MYRVVFLTGPAQKSSKYGTGPPQQKKMTKYTGPTQDTEDDRVFNKQFLFIKNNCWSCSFSCYRVLWIINQDGQGTDFEFQSFTMVREWTVAQRTFLVEKKMQGADLAQIGAEYGHR